jgi:hypothetical protein
MHSPLGPPLMLCYRCGHETALGGLAMGYTDHLGGLRPPARRDASEGAFFAVAFRIFAALTVALTLFNLYVEILAPRPLPAAGWEQSVADVLEAAGRFLLIPVTANLDVTPDETVSRWAAGLSPFLLALLFGLIGVMRRRSEGH